MIYDIGKDGGGVGSGSGGGGRLRLDTSGSGGGSAFPMDVSSANSSLTRTTNTTTTTTTTTTTPSRKFLSLKKAVTAVKSLVKLRASITAPTMKTFKDVSLSSNGNTNSSE